MNRKFRWKQKQWEHILSYIHRERAQQLIVVCSLRNGRGANGIICRKHTEGKIITDGNLKESVVVVPVKRTVQYFSFPANNGERSRPCNQQRAMGRHINGNNSQQLHDCQVVCQFTSLAASLAMFVIYGTWFNDGERIYNNFPLLMSHEPTTRGWPCIEFPLFWFIAPS